MGQHERLRNEADSKQISISRLLQEIVFAGYYKEWEPHFINQDTHLLTNDQPADDIPTWAFRLKREDDDD